MKGRVRKIGNSLGLIIPKDEARRHGIEEGDEVELEIEKKSNLLEVFGSIKFSESTQKLKDEAGKGWEQRR